MRRRLLLFFVLLILAGVHKGEVGFAQPDYAKWGRMAVQETAKRYDADIIDYLHVGRQTVSPGVAEETFKLWLRKDGREFGVYVVIRFETETERVISIRFMETAR
ncbi:DUF3889 domain-containing protein [Paenibacillus tarimensis]